MLCAKCQQANPQGAVYLFFTAAVKLATFALAERHACAELSLNNAWGNFCRNCHILYIMDVYKAV